MSVVGLSSRRMPATARLLSISALFVAACGSPPPAKETPKEVVAAKKDSTDAGPTTTAPAKKAPCADGTCTECGDGICPSGYFCVDTKGHKGCAWIASCVDKPTCACLAREVKSCSCKDEGGVARVACGG